MGSILLWCLALTPALADEGMWVLKELNKQNLARMKELGFVPSYEQLYSETDPCIANAVVIFGGGCTGITVSDEGLIFTNHHCGFSSIQQLSSVGHDYLKDGFVVDGQPGFMLQPYDEVYVRRSPGYQPQQNVHISGEILFDGTYALTNKEERLSDLVAKAGGATAYAYLRGAKLTRKANPEEKKRMEDVIRLMRRQLGETMIDSLGIRVEDSFTVGIDLEAALRHPKGDADLVLREGDVITIPTNTNTVKINGAVMVPNTVSYIAGEDLDYYLNQAGGYSDNAKKSKKFIVYMNGQVTKVKGSGRKQIEPGCEIIVPAKEKKRVNMGEILGFATSFSSLGMMIASIANLIKN